MLPQVSYSASRERLEREAPFYTRLILDAGRKGVAENLAWRRKLRARCARDKGYRALIMEACRRDVLFFLNAFCYLIEPRGSTPITLPFVTYGFQDAFVLDAQSCIGVRSMQALKTRCMGATWCIVAGVAVHGFLFVPGDSGVMSSSKEDAVDHAINKDTLFAKFDFTLKNLPWWMLQGYDPATPGCKVHMARKHPVTGSIVVGGATVEDIARGGRNRWVLRDEFGSWSVKMSKAADAALFSVSATRFDISTPKGDVGAFRDNWFKKNSAACRVELKWEDHPDYRVGMYRSTDGNLEIIDNEFWDTDGRTVTRWIDNKEHTFTRETYPFVLDGRVRSPWYDASFDEIGDETIVAQELDRSFSGSDYPFFNHVRIDALIAEHAIPAVMRVNIQIDEHTGKVARFDEDDDAGQIELWDKPGDDGEWPAADEYYMGVDVSAGTGGKHASHSVISVFRARDGVQIAEMASPHMGPAQLADHAYAIGFWFNQAKIAFEADGLGHAFLERIHRVLGYPNLFYMRRAEMEGGVKLARSPGWHPRTESKKTAFLTFKDAQNKGRVVIRSRQFYEEQKHFIWDSIGGVTHRSARVASSPAQKGKNHGDRVSAGVIALKCIEEYPVSEIEERKIAPPWSWEGMMAGMKRRKNAAMTMMPSGKPYLER